MRSVSVLPSNFHAKFASGVRRTNYGAIAGLFLQEDQIERPEHEYDYDVRYQPLPEPVPQEQEVHADHDNYQREHVKHTTAARSPILPYYYTLRSIDHPLKCH